LPWPLHRSSEKTIDHCRFILKEEFMNKPLRVLMVEDSKDDAILLLHALCREGYEVVYEVVDTPAAMRVALELQDWDVITSDHAMPHFSAPEALALAKELRPSLPFIILSGEIDLNLAVSLMKGGAQDYIQKRELPRIVPAIERELKEAESIIKRRQAEQALRESENLFRSLVDYMHDAMIILDWDGTILLANWAAARIIEYERPEDFLGHNMAEYLHPDSLQKAAEDLEAVKADKMGFLSEYQLYSMKGRQIWVESIGGKILFHHVTANLVCIRDITDRKQAEEELRRSEDRNRFLLRNTSDYIARYSLTGILLFGSDAMYHMIGYKPEEVIGTSGFNRVHPDDRPKIQAELKNAIENGRERKVEYRALCKDGGHKWVEMSAKVVHNDQTGQAEVVAVVRDISESKRAEEELQDSEEKLSLVMDGVPSLLVYVDAELRYVYVNKAYADWYGRSKADIIGKRVGDLLDEEVFRRSLPHYEMALSGNPVTFENKTIDKNGRERIVSVSIVPHFRGEMVQGFFSSIMDVTDRKEAEEALRESEERYRSLFENSIMGISQVLPDGRLIAANTSYAKMYGYANVEEMLVEVSHVGQQLYANPAEREEVLRILIEKGVMKPKEIAVVRRDGTCFTVLVGAREIRDSNGNLLYYQAGHIDITERKRAEHELHENEKRYRMAQAIGHVGSWEYNLRTTQFWGSDEAKRIYGFDPAQTDFSTDEVECCIPERKRVHQALIDLIETGKTYNLEFEIHPRDSAEPKIIASIAELQRDEHGDPLRVVGVIQDITERKRVEVEIRILNEELEQRIKERTSQLEAVNKELEAFSYSVSHDLRAPLRSIDGFSETLLEDYERILDDQGKDYLVRVRRAVKRMDQLIEDMLKLSRVTRAEFKYEKIDLSALVMNVAETIRQNNPQQAVGLFIQENVAVRGDSNLLRIAVTNLLDNAWKFTGRVVNPRIEFGITVKDGETIYYIRDNGAGFDMTYADKLFGAFQRLHGADEFPGTGIGLATVKRIINLHGGHIWAESEIQKGTIFYFTLPG